VPDNHQVEGVRLLVVEDRSSVREAVAATFESEPGFTVVGEAGSLAEARGMLEGVDVAILDVRLPDGNGADLIQDLHAANPDAKAVMFTASIDQAVADEALKRGAAAVVRKLNGFDELTATVKRLQRGTASEPDR
jgi:DNA-binding NarL/FixJ family response regulator